MCQPLPSDGNELYEKDGTDAKSMPHTDSLRCLDKAAIILANKTLEEQEKTDGDSAESQKLKKPKLAFE
ncbi:hypothetical protein CsSME_00038770 [Camellia sinensis var. sinensis]